MPFGYHLMLELYKCDLAKMKDYNVCYSFLSTMPDVLETSKQSEPFLVKTDGERYPDKAGYSGWVPVVDSGISIHTLDPMRFISVDVYTCKKLTPERIAKVKEFVTATFSPEEIEEKFVFRGEKYIVPDEVLQERKKADLKHGA
jgi:S-adenosylmethionine/arginine decarboxylase-like enzyme